MCVCVCVVILQYVQADISGKVPVSDTLQDGGRRDDAALQFKVPHLDCGRLLNGHLSVNPWNRQVDAVLFLLPASCRLLSALVGGIQGSTLV